MVKFTSTSANAGEHYWDFGDGNTSTEQNPTHQYPAAGTYIVNLTVKDSNYNYYNTTIQSVVVPGITTDKIGVFPEWRLES